MVCSCPFAGGAREQQRVLLAAEVKIAAKTASFALFGAGETLMMGMRCQLLKDEQGSRWHR